jgi:hypothetical protein
MKIVNMILKFFIGREQTIILFMIRDQRALIEQGNCVMLSGLIPHRCSRNNLLSISQFVEAQLQRFHHMGRNHTADITIQ